MKPALPPSYVNTPVPIAYAEVDDALSVTVTRILGLCWAYDYERTPALTPEQLAEFTGRPRSTLYRHLKQPATYSGSASTRPDGASSSVRSLPAMPSRRRARQRA